MAKGTEFIFMLICSGAIYESHHPCLADTYALLRLHQANPFIFWGSFLLFSESGLFTALRPLCPACGAATQKSRALHFKENQQQACTDMKCTKDLNRHQSHCEWGICYSTFKGQRLSPERQMARENM